LKKKEREKEKGNCTLFTSVL